MMLLILTLALIIYNPTLTWLGLDTNRLAQERLEQELEEQERKVMRGVQVGPRRSRGRWPGQDLGRTGRRAEVGSRQPVL